ncbi:MAG: response regulator [Geobacteraceae bacterium]|jgi:CheY-like chemotaxis protein
MNETYGNNHETAEGPAEYDAFVLVVEDNPVNSEVAQFMLEIMGCRVDLAQNGVEAVEKAAKAPYDLILMDCHMPEMDGFEATKLIRKMEENGYVGGQRRMTIIALSGDAHILESGVYLTVGMDDCLVKPYTIEELSTVLGKWLSRVKKSLHLTE